MRQGVSSDLSNGVVDIAAFSAALEETGYDSWVIVETEQIPTPGDASLVSARRALEHLRRAGIGNERS